MTKQLSNKIIGKLQKFYKNLSPDLNYGNLYQLAVAVVLSAQTTDRQVNGVTEELFNAYPSFKALSLARLRDVQKIIRSTGFYRNKAKNIIGLAHAVINQHDGKLPRTRQELMKLPGIGRKSANVILSMGFNIPALAVDTHIIRIANRLAYTDSRDPCRVEEALTALIPEKQWKRAHLMLIRHGRTVCKARKPLCMQCLISLFCSSAGKIH